MQPTLDRPMRPEEVDYMTRFRADIGRRLAKQAQLQFDRRFSRQAGSEVVVEFPRVG